MPDSMLRFGANLPRLKVLPVALPIEPWPVGVMTLSLLHRITREPMKNYQKSNVSTRRSGPTVSGHAQRWVSNAPAETRSAQRNYERYLALARAEAQNGNTVAAENYYQHAEHYFRSMSSDRAK
jgi:hypothetical protein